MYWLYVMLFYLALPLIVLRLGWRSLRAPGYRRHIGQRFGFYASAPLQNAIWVHAVSYGEAAAAQPLIRKLRSDYPDHPLVVTTMTATGHARITENFGNDVTLYFVPYDFPGAVKRFLKHCQPVIALIMETEIWPTLIRQCHQHQIPALILNARLSEKSFGNYQRLGKFIANILNQLQFIAAQSSEDAERFIKLGATKERVADVGNIKFDITPSQTQLSAGIAWRKLADRPFVWIAASTHAGEEEQVLAAHRRITADFPDALLILAPRHPERYDACAQLCEAANFNITRRSQNNIPTPTTQIYLVDNMGELPLFYRASDIAFIGGSLMPIGGHNILEAAASQAPIITGPYMHNFTAIWKFFLSNKACITIQNQQELAAEVMRLFKNPPARTEAIAKANEALIAKSGTLEKFSKLIRAALASSDYAGSNTNI